MKKLFTIIACLLLCVVVAQAQKGKAESDYYPLGYSGDTWTGEVIAFDNEQRTLTLQSESGKTKTTFIASVPNAPYQWVRDGHNRRAVDFPYDKQAKFQTFKYEGAGFAASILPGDGTGSGIRKVNNPPDSNQITDFADFKGRAVTVYYTPREREVNGAKEKYNDVWRVMILPKKK